MLVIFFPCILALAGANDNAAFVQSALTRNDTGDHHNATGHHHHHEAGHHHHHPHRHHAKGGQTIALNFNKVVEGFAFNMNVYLSMNAADCKLVTNGQCTVSYGELAKIDLCAGVIPVYEIGGGSISGTFCHKSGVCAKLRFATSSGGCSGFTYVNAYLQPGFTPWNFWGKERFVGKINTT